MPTRDTRDVTLAALASVHRQSRPPDEVILVDDGSEDETSAAVAATFPGVLRLRNDVPEGFSRAVNRGAEQASGDVLWLLNSDTIARPHAAEALAASFREDPELGIAGAALSYPDGSSQWSGGPFPGTVWLIALASGLPAFLGHVPLWRSLKPVSGTARPSAVDWVTGAAMAVRRDVWERVGPLREDYGLYCQDLDLCWQASKEGWNVRVLPEVRVVHAHGATIRLGERHPDPMSPEQQWPDLVRFFLLNHGHCGAELARSSLLLGGWLRVLVRRLVTPLKGGARQAAWRGETHRYRIALRALVH